MLRQLSLRFHSRHPNGTQGRLWACSFVLFCEWFKLECLQIPEKTYASSDIACLQVDSRYPYSSLVSGMFLDEFWFCMAADSDKSQNKSLVLPRIIGPRVNFTFVREWLKFCLNEHCNTCTSHVNRLDGMKLIDCEADEFSVIAAPDDARYVALSYVWGVPKGQQELAEPDGDTSLPLTIQDAIVTTRMLGYR
jgi:hypothetical protein